MLHQGLRAMLQAAPLLPHSSSRRAAADAQHPPRPLADRPAAAFPALCPSHLLILLGLLAGAPPACTLCLGKRQARVGLHMSRIQAAGTAMHLSLMWGLG